MCWLVGAAEVSRAFGIVATTGVDPPGSHAARASAQEDWLFDGKGGIIEGVAAGGAVTTQGEFGVRGSIGPLDVGVPMVSAELRVVGVGVALAGS